MMKVGILFWAIWTVQSQEIQTTNFSEVMNEDWKRFQRYPQCFILHHRRSTCKQKESFLSIFVSVFVLAWGLWVVPWRVPPEIVWSVFWDLCQIPDDHEYGEENEECHVLTAMDINRRSPPQFASSQFHALDLWCALPLSRGKQSWLVI
jgi:hypothetical protein